MTDYEADKETIAAELAETLASDDEIAVRALELAGWITGGKKFWMSKTFWVNVLVIAGGVAATITGYEVDPGLLAMGLGSINIGLRAITGESLTK